MSLNLDTATVRLAREIGASENAIADALVAAASLMHTAVLAQREVADAPVMKTQAALLHLNKLLSDLIAARGEAMRVHGQLVEIGREMAATEIPYCPPVEGKKTDVLKAA